METLKEIVSGFPNTELPLIILPEKTSSYYFEVKKRINQLNLSC